MKVKRIQWLTVLSIVFAAFVVGFFAGRNLDRTPVQIQTLRTASAPTEAAHLHPAPWLAFFEAHQAVPLHFRSAF